MTDDNADDDREADDDELEPLDHLDRLERQVERGGLFIHGALSGLAERINEVEPFVYGLVDVLVARGLVTRDEVVRAVAATRDELAERGERVEPGLALRVDDADSEPVPVDCAARLPVCKAVCCRLSFALTADEIEGGQVRWDLGQPYFIRHEADGACTHRHADSGACTIYEVRPGVCRRYNCADDARIWSDFARMELNHAWLEANLGGARPHLLRTLMHRPESLLRKVGPRGERAGAGAAGGAGAGRPPDNT